MRIALLSDVAYPWVTGGAERRIYEVGRRLAEDHDVHVFTMQWWDEDSDTVERGGMTHHALCGPKELYVDGRRSITEALYFAFYTMAMEDDPDYDVIDSNQHPYLQLFPARFKSWWMDAPLVATWHEVWGTYWYEYLGWKGFFGRSMEWVTARIPNAVVANSEQTRTDLAGIGVDSTVIPNGVDFAELEAAPERDGWDVMFAGRLIKEKNVDMLLHACNGLDLSIGVVGSGPERDDLMRLAGRLELDAEFPGFVDEQELYGLMKGSRTFVSPSSREGFGMAVLESLAVGTPVITVDHPRNAARHLVDRDRGLVTAFDVESLRSGIQTVLTKDVEKMGEAAREFAERYTWDEVARQTEDFYHGLL